MPPRKKLPAEVVADFEQWIKRGVPDPRAGEATVTVSPGIDIDKGRQFWAFVAPQKPQLPQVKNAAWPRTTEDHFLLAALEARGFLPRLTHQYHWENRGYATFDDWLADLRSKKRKHKRNKKRKPGPKQRPGRRQRSRPESGRKPRQG